MCLHVRTEVRLVGKRLGTDCTPERPLASMCAHVALQKPRPGEGLAAVRTTAALRMSAHVHGVGWHRDVDFVALRTLARLRKGGGLSQIYA